MKRILTLLLAALAVTGAACSDSSSGSSSPSSSSGGTTPDGPTPWTRKFAFDKFTINSAQIATTDDGVSQDILNDWVTESQLPATNLESFAVDVYLPSEPGAEPTLTGARVVVSREDGSRTPDMQKSHDKVGNETLDGQTYTVFRIVGQTSEAITREAFANVLFEADYAYGSAKFGTKMVEVYEQ